MFYISLKLLAPFFLSSSTTSSTPDLTSNPNLGDNVVKNRSRSVAKELRGRRNELKKPNLRTMVEVVSVEEILCRKHCHRRNRQESCFGSGLFFKELPTDEWQSANPAVLVHGIHLVETPTALVKQLPLLVNSLACRIPQQTIEMCHQQQQTSLSGEKTDHQKISSHMNVASLHRSHFGSRYHTRADAVTQAFFHAADRFPNFLEKRKRNAIAFSSSSSNPFCKKFKPKTTKNQQFWNEIVEKAPNLFASLSAKLAVEMLP